MKRILVPTDFSEHAEHALKVAAQIAKKKQF
jgi:nucleotide-binding universal stress UspA family protein